MFYTNVERYKNVILFRGYDKGGRRVEREINYKPKFFIPTKRHGKWKTLGGKPVEPIEFDTMGQASAYSRQYGDIVNSELYGTTNFVHQFLSEMFHKPIQFDIAHVDVTSLDIEVVVTPESGFPDVETAENVIDLITVKSTKNDRFFTWGLGDFKEPKGLNVKYEKCEDEAQLLMHFLDWWSARKPDVVTGWNSNDFDLVYLVNRIERILGAGMSKKLSPWGIIKERRHVAWGKEITSYDIGGVVSLDYLELFKKFGYAYGTQESYKLDHVAHVVLGERKLDYTEYGTLFNLAKENHQKYVEYNVRDVDLVYRFEEKMGLISLAFTMAFMARCSIPEVFGTVGIWDAFIHHKCFNKKMVLPPKVVGDEEQIVGGHVKEPKVGAYDWVASFDLNSLYPHIIMQYNMSPETIKKRQVVGITPDTILNGVETVPPEDCSMTARGNLFTNSFRGIIPEIIDEMYTERAAVKKEMLKSEQELEITNDIEKRAAIQRDIVISHNKQMALKIAMNSLYGAMSNRYFRFYDIRLAESITMSGQLAIRWAERDVNEKLNKIMKNDEFVDYVIAIDTDALYINFGDIIEKYKPNATDMEIVEYLDKVSCEYIEPLLEKSFARLKIRMNAYDQKMAMKREVIANRAIWTGKKRYAMNVLNSEGVQYKEPKQKMVGIEAVRSSTPAICRNMIKETIKVILNGTETEAQAKIAECKKKFLSSEVNDIAFPRSANNLDNYRDSTKIYKNATPIQVRASLLFNKAIIDNGIDGKYSPIFSGGKIKFVYLKKPNPIRENAIGFPEFLPEELGLHEFIDWETQFEKAFLSPIKSILDAIGWADKKTNRLSFG